MEPEGSLPHSQVPATRPCAEPDQPSPCPQFHFLKIHLNIILPSTPWSSKWPLSTQVFSPKPCVHLSSPPHVLHAPPISFFQIWSFDEFGDKYRSLSSSECSFLHSTLTSSLLGLNILLNTLFSNTLSLRSAFNVSDQVAHPYKATGKIIVLYILIFVFLDFSHLS